MPTVFCGRLDLTSIQDIFQSLNQSKVKHLLVGGYASVVHGVPRTTLDVDIALEPDRLKVMEAVRALDRLGLHPETSRVDEILGQGRVTLTNDRDVDLLASLDELWSRRMIVDLRRTEIPVVSSLDQIRLLRASGRPQDSEDAEILEPLESED